MQVGIVAFAGAPVERGKSWIGGGFIQLLLRHSSQQRNRIMVQFLPENRIQSAKQSSNGVIPTPE